MRIKQNLFKDYIGRNEEKNVERNWAWQGSTIKFVRTTPPSNLQFFKVKNTQWTFQATDFASTRKINRIRAVTWAVNPLTLDQNALPDAACTHVTRITAPPRQIVPAPTSPPIVTVAAVVVVFEWRREHVVSRAVIDGHVDLRPSRHYSLDPGNHPRRRIVLERVSHCVTHLWDPHRRESRTILFLFFFFSYRRLTPSLQG